MEVVAPTGDVGIIIGRFQVHELHAAHIELIDTVIKKHQKVIILLGVSPIYDVRNPLNFEARQRMINEKYPKIMVAPIPDMRSNEKWSKNVDKTLSMLLNPGQSAVMYGSRDSFIKCYSGKYTTVELKPNVWISGTSIRDSIKNSIPEDSHFRAGAIWAQFQKFPTSFATVDIAVIHRLEKKVLLGRKENESEWRFPGGFVDPSDESYEAAALRETREEVPSMETSKILPCHYIKSFKVEDWRYRNSRDKIKTMLFWTEYMFGPCEGGDDLPEVKWFSLVDGMHDGIGYSATEAMKNIIGGHKPLLEALYSYQPILDIINAQPNKPEVE